MNAKIPDLFEKLTWSLPWLVRYPQWRAREVMERLRDHDGPRHLILTVANHFEPNWSEDGATVKLSDQISRVDYWCERARAIGDAVRDFDGYPFRHTNFFPAEEYHKPLLDRLALLQADGFGEVEIHLHHGVDQPDNAANLRRSLEEFRDILADEHKCLSRMHGSGRPVYAFVHGNWALANSAGGRYCGVDSEMQILAETGCYADFTLPSAPDRSQVPRLNAIYECGHPLSERQPHRSGPPLRVGVKPALPVIFTGPLVFDWSRRSHGLPLPKIDNGALTANYPLTIDRLNRWSGARIGVQGRPEWVFIKLYCHGFFEFDQEAMIGGTMRRFLEDVLEFADREGSLKIHFATAREAFNMVMAAVDGQSGEPGEYRDYQLHQIMLSGLRPATGTLG